MMTYNIITIYKKLKRSDTGDAFIWISTLSVFDGVSKNCLTSLYENAYDVLNECLFDRFVKEPTVYHLL